MPAVANVAVNVDARQANRSLDALSGASSKASRSLQQTGRSAATATANIQRFGISFRSVLGPIVGVVGALNLANRSLKVLGDRQADAAALSNGLKNLGARSSELERLQKVASDLGKQTLFNQEDFTQGFALLTSFQSIGTESYERVATAAADLAQITRTDVNSSLLQLSKALQDPVRGLSALARSGTQFTDSQKQQIQALVASGRTLQAQNLILKEIERQYGGAAAAAGSAGFAGAVDSLQESFRDFQEALGKALDKPVQQLLKGLTALLDAFVSLPEPIQTLIIGVGAIGGAVAVLAPVIGGVVSVFGAVAPVLGVVVSAVGALVSALGGLSGIMTGVVAFFSGPVGWVALLIGAGVALFQFRDQIGEFILSVGALFNSLREAMIGPFKALGEIVKGVFNGIIGVAENMVNNVIQTINKLIDGVNKVSGIVGIPPIEVIPEISIPRLAKGGYVDSPQLAMIGEGSEPEYVIPESKMNRAMMRYSAGSRGESVVAGDVAAGSANSTANYSSQQNAYYGGGGTSVNITTGPVLRMNNKNYVSVSDMQRGMAAAVGAAEANMMNRMSRSYAVRRSMGL